MTHTFICHPFGDPFNTVYIKTSTIKKARELAAFRLKVQLHLVCVKPEPVDGRGHCIFSI